MYIENTGTIWAKNPGFPDILSAPGGFCYCFLSINHLTLHPLTEDYAGIILPYQVNRQMMRAIFRFSPLPWSVREQEIGFDWLCFLRFGRPGYFHNTLSQMVLRPLVQGQIGFVFSNRPFSLPACTECQPHLLRMGTLASTVWQPHPAGMGMACLA